MKADRQTPIVATNVSEQNEAIRSLEVGERLNSVFIEIDRSRFDHADKIKARYSSKQGLSKEVVLRISEDKHEPEWIREKRLKAYEYFLKTPLPKWGPSLEKLDLNKIIYYVRPDAQKSENWDEVPDEIKRTFERLGIPEAEKHSLGGAGGQYDSEVVYHNLKKEWEDKGVIFEDMDAAVQKHPELVRKYFMNKCIPINDHKFISLHGAVWSGGTFIYVPKGVQVTMPLQAYFRMNAKRGGQFEHTLIIADEGSELHYVEGCSAPQYTSSSLHAGCVEVFVHKRARVRYSSIENWSKNTFNLNTKRAIVEEDGVMEWVNGNMGSGLTMLYPSSILIGRGARTDMIGIAFAGPQQHQDTGSKVIHAAPETTSVIRAKSISKGGGISSYRGYVKVMPKAHGAKTSVVCDALLLDDESVSNTFPYMKIGEKDIDVVHEASVGKINDEDLFYLMSRGLSEEEATKMIVSGFVEPISKLLPLEYAVELNKLIEMEVENSVA